MFYTIAVDLIVLFILGLFTSYASEGIIYIIPIIAIVMFFAILISERRLLHLLLRFKMNTIKNETKIKFRITTLLKSECRKQFN
jgi:predicted membrane protein